MRVAIILLNWNGKKDTLECLDSLSFIKDTAHEIIVVDNGSTDGSLDAIKSAYPFVTLMDNKVNLGFAEGNNRAIVYALRNHFDALFLLNNDTVVTSSTLEELIAFSKVHPKAIIGAKIYRYGEDRVIDHFGGVWNSDKADFDLIGHNQKDDGISWETSFPLDYVCGAALFARADLFKDIGLFDPRFFLYWEESDLCFRAKQRGYSAVICPQAIVWHKVSSSFVGGKPHTRYFWWRNRLLWIEKNLPSGERHLLYRMLLLGEITKIFRHYFIKSFEAVILRCLGIRSSKKKEQRLLYKASLQGIVHFFIRRFYEGPSWISQKRHI